MNKKELGRILGVVWLAIFAMVPATLEAHVGWGILVDAMGVVYFTDIERTTMWKLSADCNLEPVVTGTFALRTILSACDFRERASRP